MSLYDGELLEPMELEPRPVGRIKLGARAGNPLLKLYGSTPGRMCGACRFISKHGRGVRGWFKCEFREHGGRATDHFASWPACGKFEEP
jgi:hypothetical protein